MIVDAADTNIVKPFNVQIPNYVMTDKYLDLYYLTIEMFVSLKWTNRLAKKNKYCPLCLANNWSCSFAIDGNKAFAFYFSKPF